ncbi:MAG TPA: class I SAM-dependent methyltransferase [Sphingomicrobium sp.]|nr:class I SAM-dependent methyltransferase [Sphingomicrobium sp.]
MLRPLAELPVSIDPEKVEAAIAPFLVAQGDGLRWRAEVARRWGSTLFRLLAGRETGRDRQTIESEYRAAWSAGYDHYRLGRCDLKAKPWHWRGLKLLLDPAAAARLRTVMFAAVIEELKPRRVLEVGSGNGINLLSLAGAFPDVEFAGLELTSEGVEQSRRAQSDPRIADIIRSYSPLRTRDDKAIGRIEFVQGDASAMPFENGSFDLVMTVLALEQMESIRAAALGEIARIAARHALMLEPFSDVNSNGLKRLYVRSRGYFRGSIGDLGDFGLHPAWASDDFPQEAFLGTALVLAAKGRPNDPVRTPK